MASVTNWMSLTTNERFFKCSQTHFQAIWRAPIYVTNWCPRVFCGCSQAWNYISGFPFLPLWRVQPQPISRRAHSPNTWVLPVNAGSLVNGKWYMAGRLRTKSFSLTHTPPPFHLPRLRHAYLEFTSTCDSQPRGVFILFRRKYKWHITSHKSNDWPRGFFSPTQVGGFFKGKASKYFPGTHFNVPLYGVKSL